MDQTPSLLLSREAGDRAGTERPCRERVEPCLGRWPLGPGMSPGLGSFRDPAGGQRGLEWRAHRALRLLLPKRKPLPLPRGTTSLGREVL